jgi:hypothetical protein
LREFLFFEKMAACAFAEDPSPGYAGVRSNVGFQPNSLFNNQLNVGFDPITMKLESNSDAQPQFSGVIPWKT